MVAILATIIVTNTFKGGVSVGTFAVDTFEEIGIFNGTVKIVPWLNIPGCLSIQAPGDYHNAYTTISGGIVLRIRISVPEITDFVWYWQKETFHRDMRATTEERFHFPMDVIRQYSKYLPETH